MSSLAIQCIGTDCPPFWTQPSGQGFDENSTGKITHDIGEAISQLRRSVSMTFGGRLYEMQASLDDVYEECSQPDWDGYGAIAVHEDAYEEAKKILSLLPSFIPMPEIVAEPSGSIGFEWHKEKGQVFALSVDGRHRIIYAGIIAGDREHGSAYFEDAIPLMVRQHLRRLFQ